MPALLVGPLLRHVGQTDATIWVETDSACDVEILGHTERTWQVAGHHYALLTITGLVPGQSVGYDVKLDGVRHWPARDDGYPAPLIRTIDPHGRIRIAFGSCRYACADAVADDPRFEADALASLARMLLTAPTTDWPDALLLLGDQVYADETTPATQERIRARRDIDSGSKAEVADYEEYTWLYAESWTDPDVRWLFSTLPTSMIFDDHDVRDDWNISRAWRQDMKATDWWQERIIGALSSYWVYQHLGNLSPTGLDEDELFQAVRTCGVDAEPLLREYATAADREADGAKGARWSYRRDFGRVRLVMIDSRCGRILDSGQRSMIGEAEFDWIVKQTDGNYDHLLIGTSVPWLLAPSLQALESWNELLADGKRGKRLARWSESFRRSADLDHWGAFRRSFEALASLIVAVGSRAGSSADGAGPPATVCVLSGDVHHAYVAEAHFNTALKSRVYQLTCSPFHNYVPRAMKAAFRLSWSRVAELATRGLLGVTVRLPKLPMSWTREAGPFFGNEVMVFEADGRASTVTLNKTRAGDTSPQLHEAHQVRLS